MKILVDKYSIYLQLKSFSRNTNFNQDTHQSDRNFTVLK